MKKFGCMMILAALCAMPAMAATTTLTGVITDNMCGSKHMMMPGKSDAVCTRTCVKHGAKYAVATNDGKVIVLDGKMPEVSALAGEKATVKGELKGDTMTVSSVAAAK
jgi:hypothetical protein